MVKVSDEELEEFINKTLEKDITQADSIDTKQVEEHLSQMGWIYDSAIKKLEKDGFCLNCKTEVNLKTEVLHMLEATNVDRGVFAVVSVCDKCKKALEGENK